LLGENLADLHLTGAFSAAVMASPANSCLASLLFSIAAGVQTRNIRGQGATATRRQHELDGDVGFPGSEDSATIATLASNFLIGNLALLYHSGGGAVYDV